MTLGANPRLRDGKYRATPAGWAAFAGHRGTCDRILEAGVDIFDAMAFGTPDRVAAILDADSGALTRPLSAYADDPDEGDPTPLAWAERHGKPDIAALLRRRGA